MRAAPTLSQLSRPLRRVSKASQLRHFATSSASSSSPPRRRALTDIGTIAVVGAGAAGLLLWQTGRRAKSTGAGAEEGTPSFFTVPVMGHETGIQSTKTLSLLSAAETNARLKENEASYSVSRKANPVFRYDTSQLASNSPIEDDSCCVILERDPQSKTKGDLVFWGIFDGHSGWQTSKTLSSTLVSYVAKELDAVFRSLPQYADLSNSSSSSIWSLFGSSPSKATELDAVDPIVQQAIKNGFLNMDREIVEAPLRLLEKYEKTGKVSKPGKEGKMSSEETEALNTLLPALSGSCALLTFLDAGRNKLHVACTGDSRAVMGTWEPSAKGGGKWRAEALSEDQTGKNPTEVARVKSEHPASEADTVIARGRVLGGLEPTRAFGDARYKWPVGTQEKLAEAFHPGSVRGRPRNYLTPPYVTALPEVVTIDLSTPRSSRKSTLSSFLPVASSTERTPQATRFLVLATDGLYDRLNNDEIVSLVGAHLSGVRGTHGRSAILSHVSPSSPLSGSSPSHTHAPRQEPTRGEGDAYTFEDGNLGTHLIRNALGGAKREQVSVLLSIPSPLSRRYRDDITVTVVLLGDAGVGGEGGNGGVYKREDFEIPKAKL